MENLISISLISGNQKDYKKINYRKAARAVILNKKGQLLMIHTKNGDYKFPGGGLKENEDFKEALLRETQEESGYTDISINKKIATATQKNPDTHSPDSYFIMESEYYLCTLNSTKKTQQKLEPYEKEENFEGVFITPYKALLENKKIYDSGNPNKIDWLEREILFLEEFIKSPHYNFLVKPIQKEDVKKVLEIINDGKEFLAQNNVDQWQICTPSETTILNDVSHKQGFLICKENEPVAYEVVTFEKEEAYHNPIEGSLKLHGNYATIHRTATSKKFRSEGISHLMFDFALLHAYKNNKKIIRIDTHKDNKIMQHIIKREGFEYTEIVQFTDSPRMKRLVFERIV